MGSYAAPSRDPFWTGCLVFAVAAFAWLLFVTTAFSATRTQSDRLVERCDVIEVNAYFDDQAKHVFDQLLLWDWVHDDGRYQLRAWRMVKWNPATKESAPTSQMLPRFDQGRGVWVCEWMDGDVHRRIVAESLRVTQTQYDAELTERDVLPKEHRRELRTQKDLLGRKP